MTKSPEIRRLLSVSTCDEVIASLLARLEQDHRRAAWAAREGVRPSLGPVVIQPAAVTRRMPGGVS